MEYWNRAYECMSRDVLEEVQQDRLIETVKRVYHNVPHYREKMQEKGLDPGSIKTLDD